MRDLSCGSFQPFPCLASQRGSEQERKRPAQMHAAPVSPEAVPLALPHALLCRHRGAGGRELPLGSSPLPLATADHRDGRPPCSHGKLKSSK